MTTCILLGALLAFLCITYQPAARSLGRLAVVALPAVLITSYLTVPFFLEGQFLNQTPFLERWKYDSIGASRILRSLLEGKLFDDGRLPTVTLVLMLGLAWAIVKRGTQARLALGLFSVWSLLFFGRASWGTLADLMPLHDRLLFHRFAGGVDMGAILILGLGGEWLWMRFRTLGNSRGAIVFGILIALLMAPALYERWAYYNVNALWMEQADDALRSDPDRAIVLWALRRMPPGRTYAGLRSNWGETLNWGYLHFYNLLTFENIDAFCPPYYAFSLNSDLMWEFDDANPQYYRLFNARYVIAAATKAMPAFLRPIVKTGRYWLYQAETGGYAQLGAIAAVRRVESQSELLGSNQRWIRSLDFARGRFIAYSFPGSGPPPDLSAGPTDTTSGVVSKERVGPQRIEVHVENDKAATMIFKVTYHPNWRVIVDGRSEQTFMVSPSFIGVRLPAGHHEVRAEYRSSPLKKALLLLGCLTLLAAIALSHRLGGASDSSLQH